MKYNQIRVTLQDSYNNEDLKPLAAYCKQYGYNQAGAILNRSKNLIEAYIKLSEEPKSQDIITTLAIVKEYIFNLILSHYTRKEAEPGEMIKINPLRLADLDQLDHTHRKNLREMLRDLGPAIITPGDNWQEIATIKGFKEATRKGG